MDERPPLQHYLELEYPYTVVPDDGSFFIKFPDLPGCMTQVESAAEIPAAADEIRVLWLETTYDRELLIPEPSTEFSYSGKFQVRLPKSLHRDLAEQAQREGMSLNAYVNYLLAERNMAARIMATMSKLDGGMALRPHFSQVAPPVRHHHSDDSLKAPYLQRVEKTSFSLVTRNTETA